jgi:hypothetical protein
MDKLSKEELLKILATSEKPRKQRKAQVLDEEKQIAMLERLASMRETVKKNREAKKANAHEEVNLKEKEIDDVFEKKYGSKFDKMNELLTDLNENTKEQLKLKREKANKKAEIKPEEIKKESEKEVKLQIRESVATPQTMTSIPKPVAPAVQKPFPDTNQNPSRPVFHKCKTRF